MRLTLSILSAVSTFLLLLVLFFYARSYVRFDGLLHYDPNGTPGRATLGDGSIEVEVPGRSTGLISSHGHVTYVSISNPVDAGEWEGWAVPADQAFASGPMNIVWDVRELSGFGWGTGKTQTGLRDPIQRLSWHLPYRYLTIPYWMLALLSGILPYRWFAGYRLAIRRQRAGRCVRCGKDVRGLTGACPGCGTAIP